MHPMSGGLRQTLSKAANHLTGHVSNKCPFLSSGLSPASAGALGSAAELSQLCPHLGTVFREAQKKGGKSHATTVVADLCPRHPTHHHQQQQQQQQQRGEGGQHGGKGLYGSYGSNRFVHRPCAKATNNNCARASSAGVPGFCFAAPSIDCIDGVEDACAEACAVVTELANTNAAQEEEIAELRAQLAAATTRPAAQLQKEHTQREKRQLLRQQRMGRGDEQAAQHWTTNRYNDVFKVSTWPIRAAPPAQRLSLT